jgi:hypothetical protein
MNADAYPTRHSATSADGRVRAVVDGSGRLVDLTVSDDLLHRPPWTVTATVLDAVTAAHDVATASTSPAAEANPDGPALDLAWLTAATQAAGIDADRRVAQLHTTIDDLVQSWERR